MNFVSFINSIFNNNAAIITIIIGLLSIPQINKTLNKSKFSKLKFKGYRSTLLKNSMIFSFISPILILILQSIFYEMIDSSNKDVANNIAQVVLNFYLIIVPAILLNDYMTKSVQQKVKKRYRIIEIIIIIESIISAITINYKLRYLVDIWVMIFMVTMFVYLLLYIIIGAVNGDSKKNSLKTIKILLEFDEIHNCYLAIKCYGKDFKNFHMEENYVILESKDANLVKVIPMNKIKQIEFNYGKEH